MRIDRKSSRHASSTSLGDRLATAVVILTFCAPMLGLLWFGLNKTLAFHSHDRFIPLSYLGGALAAIAGLAFAFPRLADALFDRLLRIFKTVVGWL